MSDSQYAFAMTAEQQEQLVVVIDEMKKAIDSYYKPAGVVQRLFEKHTLAKKKQFVANKGYLDIIGCLNTTVKNKMVDNTYEKYRSLVISLRDIPFLGQEFELYFKILKLYHVSLETFKEVFRVEMERAKKQTA